MWLIESGEGGPRGYNTQNLMHVPQKNGFAKRLISHKCLIFRKRPRLPDQ